MIPIYEQILGLESDSDDSLEFRRKRLLAYQRLRSPTTRKEFKNYLQEFADSVEIIEFFSKYIVKFVLGGEGIHLKEIIKILRRTMPAHLGYGIDWEREANLAIYTGIATIQSGNASILLSSPKIAPKADIYTGIAISRTGTSSILTPQISPQATPITIGNITAKGGSRTIQANKDDLPVFAEFEAQIYQPIGIVTSKTGTAQISIPYIKDQQPHICISGVTTQTGKCSILTAVPQIQYSGYLTGVITVKSGEIIIKEAQQ